jgi:hypothetical protein
VSGRWARQVLGKERVELLRGDAKVLRELAPHPWLRVGLARFPTDDGRAVDADQVGEVLLGVPGGLARSREPHPSPRHLIELTQVRAADAAWMRHRAASPATSARWRPGRARRFDLTVTKGGHPLTELIRANPGMAARLLAEHVDDGTGHCRVCSGGGQSGRDVWPCAIHWHAVQASRPPQGDRP